MNRTGSSAEWAIDLSVAPELDKVSAIRRFVEEYLGPQLDDADLVSRIAIASHELLENAVLYSLPNRRCHLRVGILKDDGGRAVTVGVQNVAAPEHLEHLLSLVAQLREVKDPADAYQVCLKKAVLRQRGSGLGLARIRCELEMSVALTREADSVCLWATTSPVRGLS